MEKLRKEMEEKRELLQLVRQMDGYQTELVLAFVVNLFGLNEEAEEARKAA